MDKDKENVILEEWISYLQNNRIHFIQDVDFDSGLDRITILFQNCSCSPGGIIESSIYFHSDCFEISVYYCEEASNWLKKASPKAQAKVYRLLNYVNAEIWAACSDGVLYKNSLLYSPRFFITEDGQFDICTKTIVPYLFYEIAPLETKDFFTAAMPELLDYLSPPIFSLLFDEDFSLDLAIEMVDRVTEIIKTGISPEERVLMEMSSERRREIDEILRNDEERLKGEKAVILSMERPKS